MTTLRMVQLADGNYAIQARDRLMDDWDFMGVNPEETTFRYHSPVYIKAYCMTKDLIVAESAFERTLESFRKDKQKLKDAKLPKVVKVIKQVKV